MSVCVYPSRLSIMFECDYCDRMFHTSAEKKVHVRFLHRAQCCLCEQVFIGRLPNRKLGNHMMSHLGNKPDLVNRSRSKVHYGQHRSDESKDDVSITHCSRSFRRRRDPETDKDDDTQDVSDIRVRRKKMTDVHLKTSMHEKPREASSDGERQSKKSKRKAKVYSDEEEDVRRKKTRVGVYGRPDSSMQKTASATPLSFPPGVASTSTSVPTVPNAATGSAPTLVPGTAEHTKFIMQQFFSVFESVFKKPFPCPYVVKPGNVVLLF